MAGIDGDAARCPLPPPLAASGTDPAPRAPARDPIAELRFLHELLGLATTAQTWEELLETVVDGTRDALGRERVVALPARPRRDAPDARRDQRPRPLPDRPRGRAVRGGDHRPGRRHPRAHGHPRRRRRPPVPVGPRASTSAASSPRCCRCRSRGTTRSSACSTSRPRPTATSRTSDVDQLSAIADLLAGIVEKGRLQREAEAQVEQLKALDQARNELIALVTHELRTPLAVVRAYTDLLADEPLLEGRSSRDPVAPRAAAPRGTAGPSTRSSGSTASSTRSWSPCASSRTGRRTSRRSTSRRLVDELLDDLGPLLARHRPRIAGSRRLHVDGRPRPPAPGARAPARERREVRAARHARSRSTGGSTRGSCGSRSPTRGRASRRSGATGSSSPTRATRPRPPAARASACTPRGAWPSRWADGCGASPRRPGVRGSSLALPAAVAV